MKALVFLVLIVTTACGGPKNLGSTPSTLNNGIRSPLIVNPSNANIPISQQQALAVTGGVGPYTFVLLSGGGHVDFHTGLYTAPGAASTASILVSDATGATTTVTILVGGGSTTTTTGTVTPTNCSAMLSAPTMAYYDSSLNNPSFPVASQGLAYATSVNISDPTTCASWCSASGAGTCMWSPGSNSEPVCVAWAQGIPVTQYTSSWPTYAAACQ